jgi:hypothetical protein
MTVLNNQEQNSEENTKERNERNYTNKLIKKTKVWSSVVILAVTGFYLVAMTSIQIKGLDITGLEEKCDLNSTLLSSKNGYLEE